MSFIIDGGFENKHGVIEQGIVTIGRFIDLNVEVDDVEELLTSNDMQFTTDGQKELENMN